MFASRTGMCRDWLLVLYPSYVRHILEFGCVLFLRHSTLTFLSTPNSRTSFADVMPRRSQCCLLQWGAVTDSEVPLPVCYYNNTWTFIIARYLALEDPFQGLCSRKPVPQSLFANCLVQKIGPAFNKVSCTASHCHASARISIPLVEIHQDDVKRFSYISMRAHLLLHLQE